MEKQAASVKAVFDRALDFEASERKAIEVLTTRDPRFFEMVRDTHLMPGGGEEDV